MHTSVEKTETPPKRRGVQAGKSRAPAVRTLAKALTVLETVSQASGLSVADIAATIGLNRTTTHRLVQALAQAGYLQQSANERGYEIGLRVLPLAAQQLDSNRVRLAALPYLNSLAQKAGERVNLGILFDGQLLYLAGIEKPTLPNVYSRFGKLAPVHCCSLGKAIIGSLPEAERNAILDAHMPLSMNTSNTIVDRDALAADMAEVARRGYATDEQEHIDNVWCVAAPIFDQGRSTAAVGISGGNREKIFSLAPEVQQTAEIITHILAPASQG